MKKLLTLGVAILALGSAPALAGHHEGDKENKGGMFAQKDANGDGAISQDEFLDAYKVKAMKKFEKMDANGDGSITQDEAKAAHSKMKEKWEEKHGDSDDSKDGYAKKGHEKKGHDKSHDGGSDD